MKNPFCNNSQCDVKETCFRNVRNSSSSDYLVKDNNGKCINYVYWIVPKN